jgi:chromosome segregation ATPase
MQPRRGPKQATPRRNQRHSNDGAGTEQDRGGNDKMSDSAEFEKLAALEARLAAAIDRIGAAAAARAAEPEARARAEAAEAATSDAQARAAELSDRVAALEARLAEAQDALSQAETQLAEAQPSRNDEEIEQLHADLATRETEKAEAVAASTALQTRVTELEARLEAQAKAADDADVAVLKRRVERARADRDAAIEARDKAQDLADEMSEAGAATPDERVMALRAELRGLSATVDHMSSGLDELRSVANGDGNDGINRVLEAQVAALTEARKAEAAELDASWRTSWPPTPSREEEARNA